jgi:molybdate transport system ATP-binding protein
VSLRVAIRKRFGRSGGTLPEGPGRGFVLETEFETGDEPGCLGILGASGSGKSLTLKCIAGIERPDEGRIEVNGRVLFDSAGGINLKPQERRVGYLFQHYALFPRMRVLENITVGLPAFRREDRSRTLERAREWIERLGLTELEGRYPAQLSGGQQQRTALARMLIREPELILLDEPFSALDSGLREQMQLHFTKLFHSRRDIVMVTHSRDEAYKLCHEILVIEGGRVLGKNKTPELFRNPGVVGVARLTGCKNISPIRQSAAREILALDWGLTLRLKEPLPPGISHVGIRAHDFSPVPPGGGPVNEVPIEVLRRLEEPFEEVVIFRLAGGETGERGELWWKFSKYLGLSIPEKLYIPPEALLLLSEDIREQG